MAQTYLFYDLETSGLNKCFDQILQFAAIRTDENFNIIEKHNFNVALREDVIISPDALLVHKISPKDLKKGKSEYEALKEIHELLNRPGTISLGYNTLGFDDEFLRFSFYRNLLTPYTHQFKNNCFRMDIYPMAVFYYLFSNDVVKWPYVEEKISLKLENLSKLNDLTKGSAHDALADVEATLNLAKLFVKEKQVYKYLSDFFVKNFDKKRCESLPEAFQSRAGLHKLGIFVSGKIGKDLSFMAPCLYIGNSRPYSNQSLWLRLDMEDVTSINKENIEETTYTIRKKYGEPPFVLPMYERFISKMDQEQLKLANDNLEYLKANEEILESIADFYKSFKYEDVPDIDPEASLYQRGFMPDKEVKKFDLFHNTSIEGKIGLVDDLDEINADLAKRLIYRNFDINSFPFLKEEKNKYFHKLKSQNKEDLPMDFRTNKKLGPHAALERIGELYMEEISPEDKKLLNELEADIKETFNL